MSNPQKGAVATQELVTTQILADNIRSRNSLINDSCHGIYQYDDSKTDFGNEQAEIEHYRKMVDTAMAMATANIEKRCVLVVAAQDEEPIRPVFITELSLTMFECINT